MDDLITYFAAVMILAGLAALLYLINSAISLVTAKKENALKEKHLMDSDIAKIGLTLANETIKTVAAASVGKLEEIFAKELRQKVKNGEADRSELFAVANEAYHEIMTIVKPELIEELHKSVKDVELYIRNQVETQLLLLKAKLDGETARE